MSNPGSMSRLDKLRALEEWLDWQLRQTRGRIRELEAQEQEKPLGEARSEQGSRRPEEQQAMERRPRTPDWGITEIGIGTPRAAGAGLAATTPALPPPMMTPATCGDA
ncbi:hypothetical protein [Streptomyces sp. NPDC048411]|uniref:hypothetical protein n=1 Tax=Streptomyces sp. NPDC048411 TaxID=3157206 RepID=UPI0034526D4C